MITAMPPRASYLNASLSGENLCPLSFYPELVLSADITDLTGSIRSTRLPQHRGFYLLVLIEAERGTFVLKGAQGSYRAQELWAEHTAMQELYDSPVPVPRSLAFTRNGELAFQLREYIVGEPLSVLMEEDKAVRPDIIRQMGKTLSAIHNICPSGTWTWEEWINASLEQAARNFATGVYDPDEFTHDEPPDIVLNWLHANRPTNGGSICLLHGDYRPKNILWQDGQVISVIDWAFVDIGDPYYDLSIIHWYMQNDTEWQQFLAAYGLADFDQERFKYNLALQKFLNV